jgi:hypothetical protein
VPGPTITNCDQGRSGESHTGSGQVTVSRGREGTGSGARGASSAPGASRSVGARRSHAAAPRARSRPATGAAAGNVRGGRTRACRERVASPHIGQASTVNPRRRLARASRLGIVRP